MKKNTKYDRKSKYFDDPKPEETPKVVTTKSLTVAKRAASETKMVGVNACLEAFRVRPQDVVRVYVETNKVKIFSKVLKECAKKKIAYKVVSQEDIDKVTETTHNEGVCFLVRKRDVMNFKKFLSLRKELGKPTTIVALENVQNPHNIGAILRVCANFGVDAILMEDPQMTQSGAVYRTAEGGAEHVQIIETGELQKALEELKRKGFEVYGTSSHGGVSLEKVSFAQNSVILFGSEADGLSKTLMATCSKTLCIPNTGHVESLNVSCAASVILYEQFKSKRLP